MSDCALFCLVCTASMLFTRARNHSLQKQGRVEA